jgi:hypothetical protein
MKKKHGFRSTAQFQNPAAVAVNSNALSKEEIVNS